ncbi:hypothetical protein AB0L74_08375 [Streptomyces sp. NPDC052020]|uniref:hypothetical protein n=1 Tax=Streptomyces sp. NPDC052020 TaxID=3155677 RepID=UPI0034284411
MNRRGRALRFTAVSALAALALTGFSTGRGHGGGHGGEGGGGGGCSSSGQDHDGSSSSSGGGGSYRDYDDDGHDYDYGGATGGSGTSGSGGSGRSQLRDAEAELVTCATEARPHAVVKVTNPNTRGGTFRVRVDFTDDETHSALDSAHQDVRLGAAESRTVEVPFHGSAAALDHCEVVPGAAPAP